MNVGGSESGQQSNYVAKGADTGDNTWNLDGIPITDMNALGSTPTLLRLRHVPGDERLHGRRGRAGVDAGCPAQLRPEVGHEQLSRHRPGLLREQGSAGDEPAERPRGYARRRQRQGQPAGSVCRLRRRGRRADSEGQMVGMGIARRGPNVNDPDARRDSRQDDARPTRASRRSAQFSQKWRGSFTFFSGNKQKDGRGAGPFNPPETTFIQDGPSKIYKGEVNYVASNSLYPHGAGGPRERPFSLTPKGGLDKAGVRRRRRRVPQHQSVPRHESSAEDGSIVDGSWFRGQPRSEVRRHRSAA